VTRVAVLGSTGSVGRSTLSVVAAHPDRFRVSALAAGSNLEVLRTQIERHRPALVAVRERHDAKTLALDHPQVRFTWGEDGLEEVAGSGDAEVVVSALVGAVGLGPTVAAIDAGRRVALATKEVLVAAGDLIIKRAHATGAAILPIDSEHNALHQALQVGPGDAVRRLVLTASGGPFRSWPPERIRAATVAEAVAHPTWSMGAKISVDSATMMNKGLEIIEAHHLFAVDGDHIDVVVHPQSVVHSLVEYVDGSLIAQLAVTDMRLPILYALTWPERLPSGLPRLDLAALGELTFEAPDPVRFPALRLAREALRCGGEMAAVMNAANEEAVAAFLGGRCGFTDVMATVARVMDAWGERNRPLSDLDQARAADAEARRMTRARLAGI
jgi:1-deoxy-D-xylulose-5-phosphate reductoisomerase